MANIFDCFPDMKGKPASHKEKARVYGQLVKEPLSLSDAVSQFTAAMGEYGLEPIKEIEPGKWNKFPGQGKSKKNRAGWCMMFDDQRGGVFGDYSRDLSETWQAAREQPYTAAERAEFMREAEAAKAAAAAKLEAEQARAANTAAELTSIEGPAQPGHPYLAKKGVQPHGIRQRGDKLLIPLQDTAGKVWSTQTIDPDGRKRFMGGGRVTGCFYLIGGPIIDMVFICEGFATGATLYQYGQKIGAQGRPVAVAFNAGNLKTVAGAIRARHPAVAITIAAASRALATPGLPSVCASLSAAMVGARVVWPDFITGSDGTDFNDFHSRPAERAGISDEWIDISAGADQTEAGPRIIDDIFSTSDIDLEALPPRDWVYGHLLLAGYVTCLAGPGGVGKSMLAITIAISVALGRSLLDGYKVPKRRNVLLLNNEDDANELKRRIYAICLAHEIPLQDLDGKLFFRSGYGSPVVLAGTVRGRDVIETSHVGELVEFVRGNQIGLVVIDPYVGFHRTEENDNNQQDAVFAVLRHICDETAAAVMVVAHIRKTGGDSEAHAGDTEAVRGGSSIVGAVRVALTLARMSKDTAKKLKIPDETRARLVRLDDGKKNFSPPDAEAYWVELDSQKLANGDYVGVPCAFDIEPYLDNLDSRRADVTPTEVAELIESLIGGLDNQSQFRFSDIEGEYAVAAKLGLRTVKEHVKLLSRDREKGTRINVAGHYIEYSAGRETAAKTAPWMVYRKVIS